MSHQYNCLFDDYFRLFFLIVATNIIFIISCLLYANIQVLIILMRILNTFSSSISNPMFKKHVSKKYIERKGEKPLNKKFNLHNYQLGVKKCQIIL